MSIPRPDTDEVKEIIEKHTGYDWTVSIDEPDKLRFVAVSYQFDIVWDGSSWSFELYDIASSYGEDEPRWSMGKMRNATEVKNELPEFIPVDIQSRH